MAGLVPAISIKVAHRARLIGCPARHDAKNAEDFMAEIRVPTLGESVTEATIGKWF